jgi:hypothetical protein
LPETEIVYITFDDGASFETIMVTLLSSDTCRLEETPLSEEGVSLGDVIKVEKDEMGRLRFRQITSKAELQTYSWLLSQHIIESPEFRNFCESVMRLGGMWEKALGGLVIVHIPLHADFNPEVEIDRIIGQLKNNA